MSRTVSRDDGPTATIDEPMLEAYTTLGFLAAHLRSGGVSAAIAC